MTSVLIYVKCKQIYRFTDMRKKWSSYKMCTHNRHHKKQLFCLLNSKFIKGKAKKILQKRWLQIVRLEKGIVRTMRKKSINPFCLRCQVAVASHLECRVDGKDEKPWSWGVPGVLSWCGWCWDTHWDQPQIWKEKLGQMKWKVGSQKHSNKLNHSSGESQTLDSRYDIHLHGRS